MAVGFSNINKPLNPRGNDASPKGYNRAALYSGKALDFDGVNDLITTPNISVQSSNVWTYTFNFYRESGGGTYPYIFDARSSGGNGYTLFFNPSNIFTFYDSQSGLGSRNIGPVFEFNKWHNIALTSDGTNVKIYVNGVYNDSVTAFDSIAVSDSLFIGARYSTSDFYTGQLSGFKAFDVALTAAQVSDLYNNPEKIVPTGVEDTALKLWLPMMEGAGTYCINGVANELVENGEFDNVTGGKPDDFVIVGTETGTNYISASNGQLSIVSDGNYIGVEQYPLTIGKTYNVRIDVESITGPGELSVYLGSGTDYHISSAGIYTIQITATATDFELKRRAGLGAVTAVINSFSIKEVGGVINGATWTHGIGSPVAQTAVIDWNHQSLGGVANILIPQGLTAGRDLLGNLFENVRKQGALNLDGNSWAEVHDNASLEIGSTDDLSMELWINRLDVPAQNYSKWFDVGPDLVLSETNYSMGSVSTIDKVFVEWRTSSSGWIYTDTGVTFNKNEWTHLVVTIEMTGANSSIKTYKNGVLSSSATKATERGTGGKTTIGRTRWSAARTMPDQIAQPRIYNRALTAEEVLRNYNSEKNTYQ